MSRPAVLREPRALAAVLAAARARGERVGLVPTMGALHDGHVSLVRAAAASCDLVVVSVFVNPTQFAASEDFDTYPRSLATDVEAAAAAGAGVVFAPPTAELYPAPDLVRVRVGGLGHVLEGRSRPGHFDGVATVVAKLFALCAPCRAFFGEKDYQQLLLVRRLVEELFLDVEVVGCPTVREQDGLAMSSRNQRLDAAARDAAPVLHRALLAARELLASGVASASQVREAMLETIAAEPLARVDYVAVCDPVTLEEREHLSGTVRLLGALRLGCACQVRLIDNEEAHVGPAAAAAPRERQGGLASWAGARGPRAPLAPAEGPGTAPTSEAS